MQRKIGGQHLLAELSGASSSKLCDGAGIIQCLEQALRIGGFQILDSALQQFRDDGCGCTAFILLTESHAAVHTYPEAGYAAVDIFSCGSRDAEAVVAALVEFVQATDVSMSRHPRKPVPCYQRR